jgi:hypothetical protein
MDTQTKRMVVIEKFGQTAICENIRLVLSQFNIL